MIAFAHTHTHAHTGQLLLLPLAQLTRRCPLAVQLNFPSLSLFFPGVAPSATANTFLTAAISFYSFLLLLFAISAEEERQGE